MALLPTPAGRLPAVVEGDGEIGGERRPAPASPAAWASAGVISAAPVRHRRARRDQRLPRDRGRPHLHRLRHLQQFRRFRRHRFPCRGRALPRARRRMDLRLDPRPPPPLRGRIRRRLPRRPGRIRRRHHRGRSRAGCWPGLRRLVRVHRVPTAAAQSRCSGPWFQRRGRQIHRRQPPVASDGAVAVAAPPRAVMTGAVLFAPLVS